MRWGRMSNLFQCKHCHFHVIAEELETHECKKLKEYKFDENNTHILWVFDGKKWYPLRLSPKFKHPDTTPDYSTEPQFSIVSGPDSSLISVTWTSMTLATIFKRLLDIIFF